MRPINCPVAVFARCLLLLWLCQVAGASAERPNILLILADDLGYGDLHCYNPDSRIATVNLDRLASEGIRFTDAHAGGSWCVPSRYSILTGRSPFRVENRPDQGPVIEPDLETVASLLRKQGYRTGMIGKWHLGFEGGNRFDYTKPLRGGPVDRGFDSFFGIHASTDIPPYFYIENDRVVQAPTAHIDANNTPGWSRIQGEFWRAGPIAPDLRLQDVQPEFTRRAVDWLERHATRTPVEPFFLYVALAAPHTPWLPGEPYRGRNPIGLYGDFVEEVDDAVGRILATLERLGLAENTLVIFASDNGPVWYPQDVAKHHHDSAGGLRGMKGDAWEAGHRVPLLMRWPGRIRANTSNDRLVCFTDFFATAAELSGASLAPVSGEDSVSLVPALLTPDTAAPRPAIVTISSRAMRYLSVRQGNWKLINGLGSGGFTAPASVEPVPDGPQGQLYNLAEDPTEQINLWQSRPDKVRELQDVLERYRRDGRSRDLSAMLR